MKNSAQKLTKIHRDMAWKIREQSIARFYGRLPRSVSVLEDHGYAACVSESDISYDKQHRDYMITLDGEEWLDQANDDFNSESKTQ